MLKYVWMLCLVGLMVPACARKVDVVQEKASLMTADSTWAQTTTDPEKLSSFFADDGALLPQGMPAVEGRDAIRQTTTSMMAMPGFGLHWKATKADVSISGDLGYTVGAYEMTSGDSSAQVTETGKYVTVWKKQADGQWKVAQDIFNADAPPPPPPPPAPAMKKKK